MGIAEDRKMQQAGDQPQPSQEAATQQGDEESQRHRQAEGSMPRRKLSAKDEALMHERIRQLYS